MKAKLEQDAVYITAETPEETLALADIKNTYDDFEMGKTPKGRIVLRVPCEVGATDYSDDDDEPVRGLADAGVSQ